MSFTAPNHIKSAALATLQFVTLQSPDGLPPYSHSKHNSFALLPFGPARKMTRLLETWKVSQLYYLFAQNSQTSSPCPTTFTSCCRSLELVLLKLISNELPNKEGVHSQHTLSLSLSFTAPGDTQLPIKSGDD